MKKFQIRPLNENDHDWVVGLLVEHWGSTKMVTRGKAYYADKLPGFAAIQENKPIGLVTYRIDGDQCEIGSLNSLVENIGIGTAAALNFYQKNGFILAALYPNALEGSRRLKPEIPLIGIDGIPLRDEIELELHL